jgi:DNA-binding response OmpR family regulator
MPALSSPQELRIRDAVLIVEDDLDVCSMLVTALDDAGIAAITVNNGSDAVALLLSRRPALILLDLQLPRIRGESVLDVIYALYSGAVPVITMTGQDLSADMMRRRGACAHLHKPFMVDDLLSAVRAYL